MIFGIGVDAVSISEIKKIMITNPSFQTVFTQREIDNLHGDPYEYYATRFACKEAVFKALKNNSIDLRIIETLNRADGSPYVSNDFDHIVHISITTESDMVIAFCVIEEK